MTPRTIPASKALPGDLIFTRWSWSNLVSVAIAAATFSRVAHCGVIVEVNGAGWVTHEAYPDGLKQRWRPRLTEKKDLIHVIRLSDSIATRWHIVQESMRIVDCPYDFLSIFGIGLRSVGLEPWWRDNPEKVICSDHCAQLANVAGYQLELPSWKVSPGDLMEELLVKIPGREKDAA